MLSLLHPSARDNIGQSCEIYSANQPFRHIAIDSFLNTDFCRELIAEFPAFDEARAINERGEVGRHAANSDVARLGPAYARFDRMMADPEFLLAISRITSIPDLLYDPDYVGGGTHENLDGEELDSHVDFNYHPRTGFHRRLNLIVFLNPRWEESWGGRLELLRDPRDETGPRAEFLPLANRAVIFETTESSWHGFQRIQIPPDQSTSRRSIAVYFYTKDRPAAESAPSHGTFYCQRPLPAHLEAGYALQEPDLWELRSLLARRDTHVRFLQQRELEFSKSLEDAAAAIAGLEKMVASLLGSASFRIGRVLTWPVRFVRQFVARDRTVPTSKV
jgi:Rps23 Pro-64 3,4-dihydroxylase Tpa1-like proline 4-hydroxylase